MQWASSIATTASFSLKNELLKMPLHGGEMADSGDIRTKMIIHTLYIHLIHVINTVYLITYQIETPLQQHHQTFHYL